MLGMGERIEPPSLSLSPTSSLTQEELSGEVGSSSSSDNITQKVSSLRINDSPERLIPGGQEGIPTSPPLTLTPPKLKSILPSVSQCTYTSCYCEENIWMLCDKIRTEYASELEFCRVSFISNPKRMVPLWRQKSGKTEEKLVIWDYHVILLYNPDERCVVYDMDSDLPFPTHFHKYVTETFRTESVLQPEYHRFFKILPATTFLNLFSSDRSHMKKSDGSYLHTPPTYPPICKNGANNLDDFLDMTSPGKSKAEFGEVFSLMELVRRFYKPRQL